MSKKLEVIKKVTMKNCPFCKGSNNCKVCAGTRIHEDYSYIMIVGNQAFSGDTLK